MNTEDAQFIDLDLDVFTESYKLVRLNGRDIRINQPDLMDLIKILKVGMKLEKIDTTSPDINQLETLFTELKEALSLAMPELKAEKVNMNQLQALLGLLVKFVTPTDIKAMKDNGIELDTDQKKIVSNSPENSLNSSTSTMDIPSQI